MEYIQSVREFVSAETLVKTGYVAMAIVIYAETGLLAGFFLPGDSLLITAGLFAARGDFDIYYLNYILISCAILGDATGYLIGKHLGIRLFDKPDSKFFKKKYIEETQLFFEKHGGKTIILARFVPIIRTFAPTLAGVGQMKYLQFASFNIFGGILWVSGLTITGFFLGKIFPEIINKAEFIIVIVVFLSLLPMIWQFVKIKFFSKTK